MARKKHSFFKKLIKLFLYLFITGTVLIGGFIALIYAGVFGHIPGNDELLNIQNHEASAVYSADGQLLGRYYLQYRDEVRLEDVSPNFTNALLAIEDIRFFEHDGLDYRAMARVFVRGFILRENAGGGSTLSQQLVKNIYPRSATGRFGIAADKLREIIIANRIERLYTKEEVLELYMNTVSFGEDTWGIKTAAERFFSTTPDELELHQAATLAGMLRATTYYNPRRNPENAIQRRNLVLWQMERYGMIDSETRLAAREKPLDLDYSRPSLSDGIAPHFREYIRSRLQHILRTQPSLDGEKYNLYTDGLRIETTIQSHMQLAAEHAVATKLSELQFAYDKHRNHVPVFEPNDPIVYRHWRQSERYLRMKHRDYTDEVISKALDTNVSMELFTWDGMQRVTATPRDSILHYLSFINSGFLAMHPVSGDILAWVGSIQHRYFQYDHVRARRPTGSAFKPIVFATALESGAEPCDYRRNLLSQYTSYQDWTPANLQEEYGGHYSLQAALSQSVNTIAVDLLMDVGIDEVRQTAEKMGIQSAIPNLPSIALGTAELTLMEMTRAYTAFANQGVPATPRYVTAIYNADGKLIYDFTESEPEVFVLSGTEPGMVPAFSEQTASTMLSMLLKTAEDGTAGAIRREYGIPHLIAGKTGTTQNFNDGWFMGIAPGLVFGSWVGGTTSQVKLPEHIGYASRNALPVAGAFLHELSKNPEYYTIHPDFYPHQLNSHYDMDCEDYRDERFRDRARDFFTGRDSQEAQIVDDESDDKSLRGRIRGWFGRD